MITGDNPFTAVKIARDLCFFSTENIMVCDLKNDQFSTHCINTQQGYQLN